MRDLTQTLKPSVDTRNLFESKLNEHRVAIVVPDGCHVEGQNRVISFGREIYTFPVSPEIKLHSPRKKT